MSSTTRFLHEAQEPAGGSRLAFYCPGCKMVHQVAVGNGPGPRWGYNGNPGKPTFTPSVLVRGGMRGEHWSDDAICHTFVTDGRIHYLGDCTHALAGQTIDLPPFRWGEDDEDDEP
jgi:hypothetical protein